MRILIHLALVLALVSADCASGATLLAVGTLYGSPRVDGGYFSTPLILRATGGQWSSSQLPTNGQLDRVVLLGGTYSTSQTSWVFGAGEDGSVLLQSVDDGLTWQDLTSLLPADLQSGQRIAGLGFEAETKGTIIATTPLGAGPSLWRTSDSGRSWNEVTAPEFAIGHQFLIGTREASSLILRAAWEKTTVADAADISRFSMAAIPGFHGRAMTGVGGRLWVAGTESAEPGGPEMLPGVYTADLSGTGWARQELPPVRGELRRIDLEGSSGIACGSTLPERPIESLCLYTRDGGASWSKSTMPKLTDITITGIAFGATGKAYAVGRVLGAPGSAFLESEDAGATWQRTETAFDSQARIRAIVRAP